MKQMNSGSSSVVCVAVSEIKYVSTCENQYQKDNREIAMSYLNLCRDTPEYMSLPKMKFKLTLSDYENDEDLKQRFIELIKRKNMAKYYEEVCKELHWDVDENLLDTMSRASSIAYEKMKSSWKPSPDDATKGNWRQKLEFAYEFGDLDLATATASSILEDNTNSSSSRAEAAFALYRVAYLRSNVRSMGKQILEITKLLDTACTSGSNWCCLNKLKVYEAIYCLATRNFSRASSLLLDCILTFESCELLSFKDIVEYTVLAGMIALTRSQLHQQFNGNGTLLQALLQESPEYRDYFYSLYDCRYAEFFQCLARVELGMRENPLLHSHYRYYVREMRLRGYSQLLQAYRTLSLNRMAMEFGVTQEYIEQEVARLIAHGKLHCKIDKVGGAVVTVSAAGCDKGQTPDASCNRGIMYQNTIKKGDTLLNRLKKLGQVTEF